MKNVIIFGAGEAGKNFIKNQNQHTIIAVADNNKSKVGELLEGIPIIEPTTIPQYEFDKIIITSMYFNPIQKQLINELNIESSKITAAHKNLLKEAVYPFEDVTTLKIANNTLLKLCKCFEEQRIPYFLDFGTLLGIIRDRELILWDDDIDISCYLKDSERIEAVLQNFIVNNSTDMFSWQYFIVNNGKGEKGSIVLTFTDERKQILKFNIDIWLITFTNKLAVQTMNQCDESHFLAWETIEYKGQKLNVPNRYKEYLQHTYGEWQTPKKETTFADYPFAFNE